MIETPENEYLFYELPGNTSINRNTMLGSDFQGQFWSPSLARFIPKGQPLYPFGVWWLFHTSGIFSNSFYTVYLIFSVSEVVHRSVVFPRFFRFPFMGNEDLQIGDTWTAHNFRRQGLATAAIEAIVDKFSEHKRKIWYITKTDNTAAIRVIEKLGFRLVAEGTRQKRMGVSILAAYRPKLYYDNTHS